VRRGGGSPHNLLLMPVPQPPTSHASCSTESLQHPKTQLTKQQNACCREGLAISPTPHVPTAKALPHPFTHALNPLTLSSPDSARLSSK
jgi:hypothetical protein